LSSDDVPHSLIRAIRSSIAYLFYECNGCQVRVLRDSFP